MLEDKVATCPACKRETNWRFLCIERSKTEYTERRIYQCRNCGYEASLKEMRNENKRKSL